MQIAPVDLRGTDDHAPPSRPLLGGLAMKMAKILGELRPICMTGWNKYNKYEYLTLDDMLGAVLPLLGKHQVSIFPLVKELHDIDGKNADGSPTCTTTIKVEYLIVDADTNDSIVASAYGRARTSDEKGVSQAQTDALKSFISKTFLLTSRSADTSFQQPRAKPQPMPKPKALSKPQHASNVRPPALQGAADLLNQLRDKVNARRVSWQGLAKMAAENGYYDRVVDAPREVLEYLLTKIKKEGEK